MESIRRRIKIFWLDHRDPIIFYSMFIAGIIVVVQFLNNMAILKSEEDKENNNIKNEQCYDYRTSKKDKELIGEFITYCKENNIEKAYSLLSNKCTSNLYPTINDFEKNYYNKIFNQKKNTKIKYDYEKNIYEIIFYPDLLESGKIENENNIIDYYKIEEEVIESKIYINYNNDVK